MRNKANMTERADKGKRRPGPSPIGSPLGYPVPLRMSPDMRDAADTAAKAQGLTLGAWVRSVLSEKLDLTDPEHVQPVRRYGGGGPEAAALHALRMQLHELGGLLVQVSKTSRLEGLAARHADAEETLAQVREAIGIISTWQDERTAA